MNFAPPNSAQRPLPDWITPSAIERTRAVFEPLYLRPLGDDEIIELLLNVGNLFRLLRNPDQSQTNCQAASEHGQNTPDGETADGTSNPKGDKTCNTKAKNLYP